MLARIFSHGSVLSTDNGFGMLYRARAGDAWPAYVHGAGLRLLAAKDVKGLVRWRNAGRVDCATRSMTISPEKGKAARGLASDGKGQPGNIGEESATGGMSWLTALIGFPVGTASTRV